MKALPLAVQQLSKLDRESFVRALGHVFEHSPWVAEMAWERRPFRDMEELHSAMFDVVLDAGVDAQLALIRAHPQLAGQEARHGSLTLDSLGEQGSAGLMHCSPPELSRLERGNTTYLARFGFPFVMAVKHSSRTEILAELEARLGNTRETEFARCLDEIGRIARYRLDALLDK